MNVSVQVKCSVDITNVSVQVNCTVDILNFSVQVNCTADFQWEFLFRWTVPPSLKPTPRTEGCAVPSMPELRKTSTGRLYSMKHLLQYVRFISVKRSPLHILHTSTSVLAWTPTFSFIDRYPVLYHLCHLSLHASSLLEYLQYCVHPSVMFVQSERCARRGLLPFNTSCYHAPLVTFYEDDM